MYSLHKTNKKLTKEIKKRNQKIKEINDYLGYIKRKKLRNEKRVQLLLEKEMLSTEELKELNKIFSSSYDSLDSFSPFLFPTFVFQMAKEKEVLHDIRSEYFHLLETIISREDFSIFSTDQHIEAFFQFVELSDIDLVDLDALLFYLTSKDSITRQVIAAFKKEELSMISSRVKRYCKFLVEKEDSDLFKNKTFLKSTTRQIF